MSIEYDRSVDPAFQEQLEAMTGVSDAIPHLRAAWEPGRPWITREIEGVPGAPGARTVVTNHLVQRYMIYEMIPIGQVAEELRDQLDGPHPDRVIRYDPKVAAIYAPEDYAITAVQWELYHASGRRFFPNPFWVVQGDSGGHKLQFTPLEKRYLRMMELPSDPAAPGDLPYAPLDGRVLRQLTTYLRLKQADREFRALKAENPEEYKRLKAEREEQYRRDLWKFAMSQVTTEEARDITRILQSDKLMLGTRAVEVPKRDIAWDRALEKTEETFIKTGRVPRNPTLL